MIWERKGIIICHPSHDAPKSIFKLYNAEPFGLLCQPAPVSFWSVTSLCFLLLNELLPKLCLLAELFPPRQEPRRNLLLAT